MLSGTADPLALANGAPLVHTAAREQLACQRVDLLQIVYEVDARRRQDVLPPALHPVNPPAITVTVLNVRDSDVGPFGLAELRIICRSGVRSRGFHVFAFCDSKAAREVLAESWGYRVRGADVALQHRNHGASATVRYRNRPVLDARLSDPRLLSPGDVGLTDTMHLTRTPTGCRIVQVERRVEVRTAERGTPHLYTLDTHGWREPRLRPTHPVSALIVTGDVTFSPVRYACRADVNALEGTERIDGSSR